MEWSLREWLILTVCGAVVAIALAAGHGTFGARDGRCDADTGLCDPNGERSIYDAR